MILNIWFLVFSGIIYSDSVSQFSGTQAFEQFHAGNLDESLEILKQSPSPTSAYYYNLGLVTAKKQDFFLASIYFKKAIYCNWLNDQAKKRLKELPVHNVFDFTNIEFLKMIFYQPQTLVVAYIAILIGFLMVGFKIRLSVPLFKQTRILLGLVLMALGILIQSYQWLFKPYAVCIQGAALQSGPGLEFNRVQDIAVGDKLNLQGKKIIQKDGVWVQVRLELSERVGWVLEKVLLNF
jgi:hypothetical protein